MLRTAIRLTAAVVVFATLGLCLFAASRTRAELTEDDYAIYSVCLREQFVENPSPHDIPVYPFDLVINADIGSRQRRGQKWPFVTWLASAVLGPFAYGGDHARWERWLKSFDKNLLEPRLEIGIPYSLVSEDELEALGWGDSFKGFDERFPRNIGVVELSAVGYSRDRTEAVLSVDHVCGLCGGGSIIRLRRQPDGSWRIIETQWTWVS